MEASALTHTDDLVAELETQRTRTLALIAHLSDADLERVVDPIMSPLVWDLGHIAAYEDLWLDHRFGGAPLLRPDLAALYDAFETPRAVARRHRDPRPRRRARLPRRRCASACSTSPTRLGTDAGRSTSSSLRHELQHTETMRQCMALGGLLPAGEPRPARRRAGPTTSSCTSPAARSRWARPTSGFAYDNERPRHAVDVPAFQIARRPVTNGTWRALLRGRRLRAPRVVVRRGLGVEGGVRHRRHRHGVDDGAPRRARLPRLLVRGRRLRPLARSTPPHRSRVGEGSDLGPAGRSTGSVGVGVDELALHGLPRASSRTPTASTPRSSSATATASCAAARGPTHPRVATTTFRNWDLPQRRQIFAGVRLARR